VDNSTRRQTLASTDVELSTHSTEEPPSTRAVDSLFWIWLTKRSQRVHTQVETWATTLHHWGSANRHLLLRYTAHGVVLLVITATLGLSHVRLTDIQLPSLTAPATTQMVRVADDAFLPSDSESYLQRVIVPRTASAVRINMTSGDAAGLAPREDVFTDNTARVERPVQPVQPVQPIQPALASKPSEAVLTPADPTLESLISSYVVEQGDTLLGIAYKHDISLEALCLQPHPRWQPQYHLPPWGRVHHPAAGGHPSHGQGW